MQSEIDAMQKRQNEKNKLSDMILKMYYNLKEVSMWVLHDKFGYDKDQLSRVDKTTESYIVAYVESDDLFIDKIRFFVEEKIGIDLAVEVKKIPQSFRMKLAQVAFPKTKAGMISTLKSINGCMELWFALICAELYTQENMSDVQIRKFIAECIDIMDYLKSDIITQWDISDILKKETGYQINNEE